MKVICDNKELCINTSCKHYDEHYKINDCKCNSRATVCIDILSYNRKKKLNRLDSIKK